MLRVAHEAGTRKMVATPHMFYDLFPNNDIVQIRDRFQALCSELKARREFYPFLNEIVIYPGAENYASPEFLEALDRAGVLTLNGSRYLLVEVPLMMPFSRIQTVVQRVFAAGYTPLLAHAERCLAFQEDWDRLGQLRRSGMIVQVNGNSLRGASGSRAKTCATTLLAQRLVDVIASDGHRFRARRPELQEAFRQLRDEFAEEDLNRWMVESPNLILANESL